MIVIQKNKPKMDNSQEMRHRMIQNQLRPIGIFCDKLLQAFQKTQREKYVLEHQEHIAYHDQLIPLGKNRSLFPVSTHAKFLHDRDFNKIHNALVIGCGMGYTVQLLKYLRVNVIGIDHQDFIVNALKKNPKLESCLKISPLINGYPQCAPYDLVMIEGAIKYLPTNIIKQISVGGFLCTLIHKGEKTPFTASVFIKEDAHTLTPINTFDAPGSLLPEFSNYSSFEF